MYQKLQLHKVLAPVSQTESVPQHSRHVCLYMVYRGPSIAVAPCHMQGTSYPDLCYSSLFINPLQAPSLPTTSAPITNPAHLKQSSPFHCIQDRMCRCQRHTFRVHCSLWHTDPSRTAGPQTLVYTHSCWWMPHNSRCHCRQRHWHLAGRHLQGGRDTRERQGGTQE